MIIRDLEFVEPLSTSSGCVGGALQSYILNITNGTIKLNINGKEVLNQQLTSELSQLLSVDGTPVAVDVTTGADGIDISTFLAKGAAGVEIAGKTRVLTTVK
jgi:hypothetical protein